MRKPKARLDRSAAVAVANMGGILRCENCGHEQPLGDAYQIMQYYTDGWPQHCDQKMTWLTRYQVARQAHRMRQKPKPRSPRKRRLGYRPP